VLGDTETEVTSFREILLPELVLLDLQPAFDDFLSFGSTDSDMHSNLLVTTDTEGTDGVASLAVYGGLARKLF